MLKENTAIVQQFWIERKLGAEGKDFSSVVSYVPHYSLINGINRSDHHSILVMNWRTKLYFNTSLQIVVLSLGLEATLLELWLVTNWKKKAVLFFFN